MRKSFHSKHQILVITHNLQNISEDEEIKYGYNIIGMKYKSILLEYHGYIIKSVSLIIMEEKIKLCLAKYHMV